MRELHVIGLTPDGKQLLLAGTPDAEKASHRVDVDARFEAVLRGQQPGVPASGPALSPKQIQARLRAGATVEAVAAAAGLPVSRVERFAGPVLSERENVLTKVYAARQSGRRGESQLPLQQAVTASLAGIAHTKPDTLEWTAFRREDNVWVAAVSLVVRGRTKTAQWQLAAGDSQVRPLDAWASQLGHADAPQRPARKAPAPAKAPKVPAKAAKAPAKAAKAPAKAVRAAAKAAAAPAKAAKVPTKAATVPAKAARAPRKPAKAPARATSAPATTTTATAAAPAAAASRRRNASTQA